MNSMENNVNTIDLETFAVDLGATRAKVIRANEIKTDKRFRTMCEANVCGMYGKCYMCPPDVGDIDEMIVSLKQYTWALVYQTVEALEDSFDFEGMLEAGERHNRLAQNLRVTFEERDIQNPLHLGAGGCRLCPHCAKMDNEPCRFPDSAMASLEAYGINVSELAAAAGMKYINGMNTVTYFGAVFF